MGVDSGLPDFRGSQGFWRAFPAIADLGLSFEEIANPVWFKKDPHLAWAFYGHRLDLYRHATPHEGFSRLLQVACTKRAGYFVFTSNVDGHFQKSGFAPDRIVECHGSIHHFQCLESCTDEIWEAGQENVVIDERAFRALEPLPKCRNCSGLARPNILMFDDWSWLGRRTKLQQERFSEWLLELRDRSAKVAVIEIGAGCTIPTVRYTSERVAERFDGRLIRINPRDDHVPHGHFGLPLGATEGIRQVLAPATGGLG